MVEGPQAGDVFALEKEITTLGAVAVEADWAILDPSHRISRRHCDIARSGRHYFLTDYSSNGTFVNGRQVPKGEPVLLRKGDRIALTDEILVRFR
jgi:predicted component of type VI protein secretion system